MKLRILNRAGIAFAAFALLLIPNAGAAQIPAEQLLPAETIFMATIKDMDDSTNAFWKSSLGRLWTDDAMRPTREKFNVRLTNDVAKPLEKELKIKGSDYLDLLHGQVTLALTKSEKPTNWPGFLLLIDAKDKSEFLKTNLTELRKKWADAGKQLKFEKIRDVEFATYQFTQAALQKVARRITDKPDDAAPDPEAENTKIDILVGQSQSLLLIGTQPKDLEKILARQNGGLAPALAEQPVFQANFNSLFRDANAFAWLDFKPIFDFLTAPAEPGAPGTAAARFPNLQAQKILPALGLGDLKSIAAKLAVRPEGYDAQVFLTVPEASRQGLVKVLAPPAKDASPPPFVPADAAKFSRVRIDFQQAWAAFESMLTKLDPTVAGIVQLMLGAAGKEKDPNFDLKKSLIDSVGDDFISYEKISKNPVPPQLSLIGAREPEQFLNGIRVILRMLPEPIGTTALTEREFLGRKIYTLSIPGGPVPGASASQFLFSASGGYVAMSSDAAILEEFLRSPDAPPKPLRDLPGFAEAAQKVGGMGSGWFTFENEAETMRDTIEKAKAQPKEEKDAAPEPGSFGLNPLQGETPDWKDWIDLASLPAYDQISKYFYYVVSSGSATPEGISFKVALPTPPTLK